MNTIADALDQDAENHFRAGNREIGEAYANMAQWLRLEKAMPALPAIRYATQLEAALAQQPVGVEGTWLWCKLMNWCREQCIAPATQDKLFAIAGEAHRLNALAQQPEAPAPAPGAVAWVVANGQGTRWRKWGEFGPEWTSDRDAALHFSRHADAEAFSREDEDAWFIQPVDAPQPSRKTP